MNQFHSRARAPSSSFSGVVCGLVAGLLTCTGAHASEGGGGAYPNGAETVGVAQLPPPGTYVMSYSSYYDASRFNDADGDSSVPDFKVEAWAETARIIHVTDIKILGATWAQQMFIPLVDLSVDAAGAHGHKTGLGDITVNPMILSWDKGDNHWVVTMDINVPTGRYDKQDMANIGRNYWTFEPVVAFTHASPKGGLEASVKLMYDFNTRNKATDYTTGQEFHADFALAYTVGKWTAGADGYYYVQVTDDKQYGLKVGDDGFKGEALAFGPVVRYQAGKVPVWFQWQHEVMAHNRTQGDRFWIKAAFRF